VQNRQGFYETKIVTGSYDEKLRIYSCEFSRDPLDALKAKLALLSVLEIPGSGVWRIRELSKRYHVVAGMYSGIHVVDLSVHQPKTLTSLAWKDHEPTSPEENELIYDVIEVPVNEEEERCLVCVSFYKKTIYFVSVQESLQE